MDPATTLGAVLSACGLAGATGLSVWLPLLLTAVLERLGVVELADFFEAVSSPVGLVVVSAMCLADVVGGKVPRASGFVHELCLEFAPLVGGLLFAAQLEPEGSGFVLAGLAGGVLALAVHYVRSIPRMSGTGEIADEASPRGAVLDDVNAIGVTFLALALPLAAALVVLGFLLYDVVFVVRLLRRR